ncbi:hypothetical protein FKM82_003581 [Ascaphus truei]|uniref:melanocyte-stimulating hormone receptor n=1 Tax=Ascaphus truei TaxID=8439 RepID=UPI003F5ACAE8
MTSLRMPTAATNSTTNYSLPTGTEAQPNQTAVAFQVMPIPDEIFLTLCVFSLLENIMVIVAILKNRNLHSPMYYFICCLAVADMLVGISHLGETLFMLLIKQGLLKVGPKVVKQMDNVFDMMICSSLVSSLSFLGAIAVDRYITIFYALRYHSIMTLRRVGIVIAGIWLASTACSIIFIIYDENRAVILCLIGFFLFMLALMVALYIHMFALARRHARKISSLQKRKRGKVLPPQASMKGAITLTILLGIFFLCWGPFFLHLTLIVSCPRHPACLSYFNYFNMYLILIICNSVIDPLIYAFRSQELRKSLRDIVMCSW